MKIVRFLMSRNRSGSIRECSLKLKVIVRECLELVRSKIFDLGGVLKPEKIFDRGGGARYPLLCKFLAR